MTQRLFLAAAGLSLLFSGAIFGFFYAYFSSVLNGFDTMDGGAAIEAMNAINREVRNARFFPIFFLTPLIGAIAAALGWAAGRRLAGLCFLGAAIVYAGGAMAPTILASVPLNQALMTVETQALSVQAAAAIWDEYSTDWSWWNGFRTFWAGLALLLCAGGVWSAGGRDR